VSAARGTLILIGVGSNLQPRRHVPRALRLLRETFGSLTCSTFYRTRPLGRPDQPPYANGVAVAATCLALPAVRAALRAIEYECGRVRDQQEHFAARTMDLDLLAFGEAVLPDQNLPAAELLERDFCLVPAAEVLPEWLHPVLGRPLRQLAAERFPTCPNILGPVPFRVR
jgi:2-amino-4-hydroxy-6-hydroxymethyldihydropteridine diphosphokinase